MKLKPILGFWIYAEQRKPIFVIDAKHDSVLDYHFGKSEVPLIKQLISICEMARTSKTFEREQFDIEVVIDPAIAPCIMLYKHDEKLMWSFYNPKLKYENAEEESGEGAWTIVDFCRTQGEAARLTKPRSEPMFDRYVLTAAEKMIGRNEEESE